MYRHVPLQGTQSLIVKENVRGYAMLERWREEIPTKIVSLGKLILAGFGNIPCFTFYILVHWSEWAVKKLSAFSCFNMRHTCGYSAELRQTAFWNQE